MDEVRDDRVDEGGARWIGRWREAAEGAAKMDALGDAAAVASGHAAPAVGWGCSQGAGSVDRRRSRSENRRDRRAQPRARVFGAHAAKGRGAALASALNEQSGSLRADFAIVEQ